MNGLCEKIVGSVEQTQTLLARSIVSYCSSKDINIHALSTAFRKEFPDDGSPSLTAIVETPRLLSGRRYQQVTAWVDRDYILSRKRVHNPIYPLIGAQLDLAQLEYMSLHAPAPHGVSFHDDASMTQFFGNHKNDHRLRAGAYIWREMVKEIDAAVRSHYQFVRSSVMAATRA